MKNNKHKRAAEKVHLLERARDFLEGEPKETRGGEA